MATVGGGTGEKPLDLSPRVGQGKTLNPEAQKFLHNRGLVSRLTAIMKRKLDEHGIPTAVETKDASKKPSKFGTLGLDSRLLQAIAQQNYFAPTEVQSKAIPLALEGKDILGMMFKFAEERYAY